jgi:hypothetical protein
VVARLSCDAGVFMGWDDRCFRGRWIEGHAFEGLYRARGCSNFQLFDLNLKN